MLVINFNIKSSLIRLLTLWRKVTICFIYFLFLYRTYAKIIITAGEQEHLGSVLYDPMVSMLNVTDSNDYAHGYCRQ